MTSRSSYPDVRAALHESEERYRFLLDHIPVHVWTATPEGELDFVSEHTIRLLGETRERLLAEGFQRVVHPDDVVRATARWRDAVERGHEYHVEFRLRVADGSYAWHLSRACPERRADGTVARWLGTNTNIDEQHTLRDELRALAQREEEARRAASRERERQRRLFTNAPVAIAMLEGPEHVFTFANPAYCALVNGRDVVGKTLLETLPDVRGMGIEVLVQRAKETGEPQVVRELPVRAEGDQRLRVNFVYTPMPDQDGVLVTGWDVTESVESRARAVSQAHAVHMQDALMRLVTDSVPVLISFVTADERYGYVNQHYHACFGLRPEQILGRTLRDVLGEAAYAQTAPLVKRALSGERFGMERYGVRYEHGGTRDVKVEFIPQRNAAGDVIGYAALVEDITDRRAAQHAVDALAAQKTQALEAVSQALRVQSDFEQKLIGIVSHDLRTPLNAIVMATSLLAQDESLSAASARVVLRARSAADRATRMIRDMLDFTQARLGGGIRIEPRAADLGELVDQVLGELEAALAGRTFDVHVEGDARGVWDPDRIAQVVQNLLGNAIKYSHAASTISVQVSSDVEDVALRVHNAGGIAAEKLAHIFEPFQRATTALDRASRSVGLGLYIVDRIVEAHRGRVEVTSTEADGTTFYRAPPARPRPGSSRPGAMMRNRAGLWGRAAYGQRARSNHRLRPT